MGNSCKLNSSINLAIYSSTTGTCHRIKKIVAIAILKQGFDLFFMGSGWELGLDGAL